MRWAALFLLSLACRTTIVAAHRPPPNEAFVTPKSGCAVQPYPSATDLPEGALNLGWISVSREPTDEETYLKLREEICQKGGNALSQLRWVNETTKDAPVTYALEANAWQIGEGAK